MKLKSNKFINLCSDELLEECTPMPNLVHKRSDKCRVRNLNRNIDYILNRFGEGCIYDEYLTSLRAERDSIVKRMKEKEND